MVPGRRFDLEAARAEARAAKRAARIRAIASNAVLALVLLALAGGGWYGWRLWQERRAAQAAEEQAARDAEARAEAERQRAEAARQAEAKAARAAEAERRAAEQAKREAERRAREEERVREQQAREEKARLEKENEAWQRANKDHVDKAVSSLRFSVFDHIFAEHGTEPFLDIAVDERRWVELAACVSAGKPIDLLDMLRGENVTNDFSVAHYPDRATLKQLLDNLAKERFTMVVRLKPGAPDGRRLALVTPDPQEGLVVPPGGRTLKDANGRPAGWTAPFAYGAGQPLFVMSAATVDRFNREWRALASRIRRDAAKLDNAESFVAARLEKEIADFVRSVKIEIKTPPPAEQKKAEPRREPKIKSMGLKGSNTDIRKMNGPHLRR